MIRLLSACFTLPVLFLTAGSLPRNVDTRLPALRDAAAPSQQSGREIFQAVCAACHSVQPPPDQAPPMSHMARHYLEEADRDAA